ncbi:MAG TPA: tetraacyldisaccharide 4'-kinase [Candidatus Methylacidiphilales bacterium]|jgi:tetraacyldisaccharide 4'-kinase|nr:tetraacyldisaccharide 4'-kinase [Candidatus Methylacidiphilales bacterium]
MPGSSHRFRDELEQFAVDVILERRWGFRAGLFRFFLWGLSGLYRIGVRWRLWWFETRLGSVHALGCLVVSVGNLTVGGTGKTPVVELFARELTRRGRRVAVLSRGYKSQPPPFPQQLLDRFRPLDQRHPPRVVSDGRSLLLDSEMAGDEPFMLASNLKDVLVLVDKDRVKSGLHAIRKFGCDTLLLDDGLQFLRLKERLDIVLVDSESPFANRYLLPRGLLREPPEELRRANIIFITKCDGRDLGELRAELRRYNNHAEFVECAHKPLHLEEIFTHEVVPLSFLKDLRIGMISGIARPESFEEGLRKLGVELIYSRRFADHHRFSEGEIAKMFERSKARGARAVITTEKDSVRFPRLGKRPLPVYFLRVEIEIIRGHDAFHRCLEQMCRYNEPPVSAPAPEPLLAPS